MKTGTKLKANLRLVPFSFWPVDPRTTPRPPIQSPLFAIDPWLIMRHAITEQIENTSSKAEALSYIDQAADFYDSALQSQMDAAKPVQLYYSYLNVAKAFVLCRGMRQSLPTIRHGIIEKVDPEGEEFVDAYVQCWSSPDSRGHPQAFDEFVKALGYQPLQNKHRIPIAQLVPQILPGHRLWAMAAAEEERFISLPRVEFIENKSTRQVWLRLYLLKEGVSRVGHTQDGVLHRSGSSPAFRKVRCSEKIDGRELICFEQSSSMKHNRHGVDVAMDLVDSIKKRLWAMVGSSLPYRRYYLYVCPTVEQSSLLPQLASIYALTYYLGSLTRYRPNVFRSILEGDFGPRIAEFISGQPAQFIYLMASEFAKRDVTRPAIV